VLEDNIMLSAHFIPSTAADIIPPAYPAPSPQGKMPLIDDWRILSRTILTGDVLLVSGAVRIAFSSAKHGIRFSNSTRDSLKTDVIFCGRILLRSDKVTPGLYVG